MRVPPRRMNSFQVMAPLFEELSKGAWIQDMEAIFLLRIGKDDGLRLPGDGFLDVRSRNLP